MYGQLDINATYAAAAERHATLLRDAEIRRIEKEQLSASGQCRTRPSLLSRLADRLHIPHYHGAGYGTPVLP
nr:hypothetical protein [Actinomycetales bacterium]